MLVVLPTIKFEIYAESCHFILSTTLFSLSNALIFSRLDYCNSLYTGILKSNLTYQQRIQNSLTYPISKHVNDCLSGNWSSRRRFLPISHRVSVLCSPVAITRRGFLMLCHFLYHTEGAPSRSVLSLWPDPGSGVLWRHNIRQAEWLSTSRSRHKAPSFIVYCHPSLLP